MTDDLINGFQIPLGSRNYRPEHPADYRRRHSVFWTPPKALDAMLRHLYAADALHRAVFLAAASGAEGYFLDFQQVSEDMPEVDKGMVWCGILNDDEPTRGGGRGPTFFDQSGLTRLVALADSIIVNSAGVNPEVYAEAPSLTASDRKNSLLIETDPRFELDWMRFVQDHRGSARYTLVTPNPFNPNALRLLSTHDKPSE